jgi:hypothetical protein
MKRFAVLAVIACALSGAVRAGSLDMVVDSTSALPGKSGAFDVSLKNNSATAVTVAAFSLDVW